MKNKIVIVMSGDNPSYIICAVKIPVKKTLRSLRNDIRVIQSEIKKKNDGECDDIDIIVALEDKYEIINRPDEITIEK